MDYLKDNDKFGKIISERCVTLAEKYGLSDMTMEEIQNSYTTLV
jgi:hypothetical protein